jgi:hypothetical protein
VVDVNKALKPTIPLLLAIAETCTSPPSFSVPSNLPTSSPSLACQKNVSHMHHPTHEHGGREGGKQGSREEGREGGR